MTKAIKHIQILLLFSMFCKCAYSQKKSNAKNKIIIEAVLPSSNNIEFLELSLKPAKSISFSSTDPLVIRQPVKNGLVKWVLNVDSSQLVRNQTLLPEQSHSDLNYLIEPGDSIRIQSEANKEPIYTGKGALKFQIIKLIKHISDSIDNTDNYKVLSHWRVPPTSLSDFLAWNNYLNLKLKLLLPLIEKNKKLLSVYAYVTIKSDLLEKLEQLRLWKFMFLRRTKEPGLVNHYNLTNQDLCAIYDSTMNNAAAKWLRYERPFLIFRLTFGICCTMKIIDHGESSLIPVFLIQ